MKKECTLLMIVVNKWFHKVTNYQVLSRPNICGLQLMIDKKSSGGLAM